MVTMRLALALAFTAPLLAQTCTYVVTPPSFTIPAGANFTGTFRVTQTPGSACGNYSVTVPSQILWIHITSPFDGAPG